MPERQLFASPKYIDEVENALGIPFFTDAEKATIVRENPQELGEIYLGERRILYTATLRALRLPTATQTDHLDFIARQLALINNVERPNIESGIPLRRHQNDIVNNIPTLIRKRPTREQETEIARMPGRTVKEIFTKGATIVSPTSTGKTVMAAYTFTMLGIGEAISPRNPEPLQGLFITNGELVPQMTGETSDDTLRRAAPGLHPTAFYSDEKDLSGNLIVTTRQMFKKHFRDGHFCDKKISAIGIDEVHHLTEPEFLQAFHDEWRGPAYGFTATPSYHPQKDARLILPYVISRGNILSYIKNGIINGAQLFTFAIDPRLDANLAGILDLANPEIRKKAGRFLRTEAVVDFAVTLINQGKRGIIFCEQGEEGEEARKLQERFSGVYVHAQEGKRKVSAKMISSFQSAKENKEVLQAHDNGTCDVITSVGKGSEGLNGKFDFVLHATQTRSPLRMKQRNGRGGRLSEEHPITVYGEFFTPSLDEYEDPYISLWDDFELDTIEQGRILKKSGEKNDDELFFDGISSADLPPNLQKYLHLFDKRLISDITLAPGVQLEVPPDYIPEHSLVAETGKKKETLRKLLRNFPRAGTWEMQEDGDETFVRYYHPDALAYLLFERPVAPKRTPEVMSVIGISQHLDCSEKFVKQAITKGQQEIADPVFQGEYRSNKKSKNIRCYKQTVINFVEVELEKIPKATKGHRTVEQLVEELGCSTVPLYCKFMKKYNIVPISMRHVDSNKTGRYMTPEEAEIIRDDFYSTPLAKETDITLPEICTLLGLKILAPAHLIQEEQKTLTNKRTIQNPGEAYMHTQFSDAIAIIKRLLPISIPTHLVPRQVILQRIYAAKKTIDTELKRYQRKSLNLPGKGSNKICYPWHALQDLEQKYGVRDNSFSISYKDLAHAEDEVTEEKTQRAREIYERYLIPEQLVIPPTFEEILEKLNDLVVEKKRKRDEYLSFGDRAEQFKRRENQPYVKPTRTIFSTPNRESKITQETKDTQQPQQSLSAQAIAEKTGTDLAKVEKAIAFLRSRYETRLTVQQEMQHGKMVTTYLGNYLEAILMTTVGRTGERLAEIVGMPEEVVLPYLQEHHQMNEYGRYGLTAMQATMAEFRKAPSRNYTPIDVLSEETGMSNNDICNLITKHGGSVDYFYLETGEKAPFLSQFNHKLFHALRYPDSEEWAPIVATGNWLNRYEIAEKTGKSLSEIDALLTHRVKKDTLLWLMVRDPNITDGARILPHYPLGILFSK